MQLAYQVPPTHPMFSRDAYQRRKPMKAVRVLSISAVLFSLVFLSSCSKKVDESLYFGTFTSDQVIPEKTVRAPGSFKDYSSISDLNPVEEGTEKIVKAWTDGEGNTWFQTYATITTEGDYKDAKVQTLAKVSKGGAALEFNWFTVSEFSPNNFPRKIDKALATNYRSYNRAGN
jgi:hypothetical protein